MKRVLLLLVLSGCASAPQQPVYTHPAWAQDEEERDMASENIVMLDAASLLAPPPDLSQPQAARSAFVVKASCTDAAGQTFTEADQGFAACQAERADRGTRGAGSFSFSFSSGE